MNVADFTRALLDGASFRQTILTDADFHAADINEALFLHTLFQVQRYRLLAHQIRKSDS